MTHECSKRILRSPELFLCINLNLGTAVRVEILIKTGVSFLVGRKRFRPCCSGMSAILRRQQPLLHSAEVLSETLLSPQTNRNDSSIKIHLHLHYSSSLYVAWGKEVQREVSFKTYLEICLEHQLITCTQFQRAVVLEVHAWALERGGIQKQRGRMPQFRLKAITLTSLSSFPTAHHCRKEQQQKHNIYYWEPSRFSLRVVC